MLFYPVAQASIRGVCRQCPGDEQAQRKQQRHHAVVHRRDDAEAGSSGVPVTRTQGTQRVHSLRQRCAGALQFQHDQGQDDRRRQHQASNDASRQRQLILQAPVARSARWRCGLSVPAWNQHPHTLPVTAQPRFRRQGLRSTVIAVTPAIRACGLPSWGIQSFWWGFIKVISTPSRKTADETGSLEWAFRPPYRVRPVPVPAHREQRARTARAASVV
jgi:hypothetical protein